MLKTQTLIHIQGERLAGIRGVKSRLLNGGKSPHPSRCAQSPGLKFRPAPGLKLRLSLIPRDHA